MGLEGCTVVDNYVNHMQYESWIAVFGLRFDQNMFSAFFSTDGGLNFQINSSCVGVVLQYFPKILENGGSWKILGL